MIVNGTTYKDETPQAVINILENNRLNNRLNYRTRRLRLHYGNTETGKDWMDIYDVTGYIGRSTGRIQIPILIHNTRSLGGGGILDHCIIKITETVKPHKVLYEHPLYHTS